MSAIVEFNNLSLEVLEYQDTWALSDRQVAQGFGVTQEAIRKQRTQGATEYREGVHFYYQDVIQNKDRTMTPLQIGRGCPTPKKWYFGRKRVLLLLDLN
jgi:hypothetical protein